MTSVGSKVVVVGSGTGAVTRVVVSGNLPEVLSRAMQAMIVGFARSGPPEIFG
jgi:hypothetical protein